MEAMAVDEALRNNLVVSTILSFLDHDDFLGCRTLSKLWSTEALQSFHRRDGLYFQVGPYMAQKYLKEGTTLPAGSSLVRRVFAGGVCSEIDEHEPKDFLLFFRSGDGGRTEVLFLDHRVYDQDQDLTWGGALHEIIQSNSVPSLRELIIDFEPEGRVNADFEGGDTDLAEGLRSLKILQVRCCWDFDDIKKGTFTPFINALIKGAGNLEKVVIRGCMFPLFPETAETEEKVPMRGLKALELDICEPSASLIPEFDRVLSLAAKNCHLLESLSMPFLIKGSSSDLLKFPKFLKVTKFVFYDHRRLPFAGDFVHFLKEKLPVLRSLKGISDLCNPPLINAIETLWKSIFSSKEKHHGLHILSIPAPKNVKLLTGLGTKFPSLKNLHLCALNRSAATRKKIPDVDWIAELASVLADKEVHFPSTIFINPDVEVEKVREKFLLKMGPGFKGTFVFTAFEEKESYEIRITPEKEEQQ